MKEVIIIETNQARKLKNFLDKEQFSYKVYWEPKTRNGQKINIFANYGEVINNREREQELKLWDNVDLDEKLNEDGEWWS